MGTIQDALVEKKRKYKTQVEETKDAVYRSTVTYETQMASIEEQARAHEVDFVIDSPET